MCTKEQNMNPKVDGFLNKAKQWRDEFETLRAIALKCGLTEDMKWGHPCYTCDGNNIVLIHGFKAYAAFLFFKGALLKDTQNILIKQTENVQSARQIRFTSVQDIITLEPVLKAYIGEAIEVEKAGLKVAFKKASDFTIPEEFQYVLDENEAVKTAFEALTPGRQKAYILHFSEAKQSKTRHARVEKWLPQILSGKGLDD
jgi:uncharacterized protein YdeI (YjbR/CyaY-like superfamily)